MRHLLMIALLPLLIGLSPFASAASVTAVLVGDTGIGKTSLLIAAATNGFPSEIADIVFDADLAVRIDGEVVAMTIRDTDSQGAPEARRDALRDADAVLLAYAVDNPASLQNVAGQWHDAVRGVLPGVPLILVGLKADLRDSNSGTLIPPAQVASVARDIGAAANFEVSALTSLGVKSLMTATASIALAAQQDGMRAQPQPDEEVAAEPTRASLKGLMAEQDIVTRELLAALLVRDYDIADLAPPFRQEGPYQPERFDYDNSPYRAEIDQINTLAIRGLSVHNGQFEPQTIITRSQLMLLIEELLSHNMTINRARFLGAVSPFSDLPSDSTSFNAVMTGVSYGITTGLPDGSYRPDHQVSGAEVLAALDAMKRAIIVVRSR